MGSATTIRRARPEDKDALWAVRTRAIAHIGGNFYSREELERWFMASMPERFDETIRTKAFLVAETDGVIVGHGFLDRETGEIDAIFVDPSSQRRGIGTQLLIALERIARSVGLTSLHLSATLNSVPFYRRAGFAEFKVSKYQHPQGFELACVVMRKTLYEKTA